MRDASHDVYMRSRGVFLFGKLEVTGRKWTGIKKEKKLKNVSEVWVIRPSMQCQSIKQKIVYLIFRRLVIIKYLEQRK